MRFRLFCILGLIVFLFAGVSAVNAQLGTAGSIRATATVSSPVGLLAPNSVASVATNTLDRSAGWLLISPRRGVVVICDSQPLAGMISMSMPLDKRTERVFEYISLPKTLVTGSIVTIIYTEN